MACSRVPELSGVLARFGVIPRWAVLSFWLRLVLHGQRGHREDPCGALRYHFRNAEHSCGAPELEEGEIIPAGKLLEDEAPFWRAVPDGAVETAVPNILSAEELLRD